MLVDPLGEFAPIHLPKSFSQHETLQRLRLDWAQLEAVLSLGKLRRGFVLVVEWDLLPPVLVFTVVFDQAGGVLLEVFRRSHRRALLSGLNPRQSQPLPGQLPSLDGHFLVRLRALLSRET